LIDYQRKQVKATTKEGQSIDYSTHMKVPLTLLGGKSISVDQIFQ
jgi:hypothetical protein